jgi:hypothetical protein
MPNQHPRGRAKPSLLETEALARFFEPVQKDPTVESEIQHHLDVLDQVAREMEETWGVGRLIPLVDDVLRGKFFKQQALLNKAIAKNDPDEVATHATALARGWRALDQAARGVGHKPKPHAGLEIRLNDGRIVAIVPDGAVPQYRTDGTEVVTLTEASLQAILSDLLSTESVLGPVLKCFPAASLASLKRKPEPDWGKGDDLPF